MFRLALSEGIELRLVEERHAEAMFAVVDRNRAYLREWLPWVDATTGPASVVEFIRKTLHQFARNEGFAVGIWAAGQYFGGVGFHTINWVDRKVEIGYWLDREQQGKGLMSASCRAMIAHAFEELKLNRVEIRCATGNQPSNRVAQRLGFRLEGTLRSAGLLYGTYHDLNIYGLLVSEWEERN
jgi:ribosomal-protein-serine acetyltransferase